MGMLLRWRISEETDVSYDKTIISRASSQTGTYSEINTQDISDNTYFDSDGTSTSWYKMRFRGGSVGSYFYSDYSSPMQGAKWRGYCSPNDVRIITNLDTADVTDSKLYDIITFAMGQINHEINSKIIEEIVERIDITRQNFKDGSNTTYYVQKSFKWYIGDMNDDGVVDTTDINVYKYASDGTKTELTVTSITPNEGKFVVSTAPEAGCRLVVTYSYAPVSESDPNPMLKQACAYLSASLAYMKIETGDYEKLQLGKLSLGKTKWGSGVEQFQGHYGKILNMIKSRMMRRTNDPDFYKQEVGPLR